MNLEAVTLLQIVQNGNDREIVCDVETADVLAPQRNNVVDVEQDALPVEGRALAIDATNGRMISPLWSAAQLRGSPAVSLNEIVGAVAVAKDVAAIVPAFRRIGRVSQPQSTPVNRFAIFFHATATTAHRTNPRRCKVASTSQNIAQALRQSGDTRSAETVEQGSVRRMSTRSAQQAPRRPNPLKAHSL